MKRRVRRKKKQRTTICLTVFVLGITFIGAIVCIGILYRKQNTLVSPEELLVEYMNHIPNSLNTPSIPVISSDEVFRMMSSEDFSSFISLPLLNPTI